MIKLLVGLVWVELNDELSKAGRRNQLLCTKFNEFAKQVADQITAQHYLVKGLEAELHLDERYFVVRFVGRVFQFHLETMLNDALREIAAQPGVGKKTWRSRRGICL